MRNLAKIINQFSNRKVLVIGDFMVDKYIWGNTRRISPEAPIQIIEGIEETYSPGGAANVAANINSLGGKVYAVGVVGEDKEGRMLLSDLKNKGIEIQGIEKDKNKPTIIKMRIMSQGQQLLRVDYEDKGYIKTSLEKKLHKWIKKVMEDVGVVVVADYGKGTLTPNLIEKIIGLSKKYKNPIVCDFKSNHQRYYRKVTHITPSLEDAREVFVIEMVKYNDLQKIGKKLLGQFGSNILITKGEKGLSLFEASGRATHISAVAKEVYDVCGAGDTVLATAALSLVSGASLKQAAFLGNLAGGIAVGKRGTSLVAKEELLK